MYRHTYIEINLKNLTDNVKNIISNNNEYTYYFGVVKADCYGHGAIEPVKSIIKGGCNYLAVATLEEALTIREEIKNIPILCFGIIPIENINICLKYNITVTIPNLNYLNELLLTNCEDLKVHIKINTGMNRLGIKEKDEFNKVYNSVVNSKLKLEGLYTHIHTPDDKNTTLNQFQKFEDITSDIDLSTIPIIHLGASEATLNYPKRPYANGCRLGINMYDLCPNDLNLKSTFKLISEVISINECQIGETVGYNGNYKVTKNSKIAVIPIGYADGIIRKNTGRSVYINNKEYKIVGNICMDMLFVLIDDTVKIGDKVTIIKDSKHIQSIAKHLDTIPYEILCTISKRVPRLYIH